jgi:hypothetical protein
MSRKGRSERCIMALLARREPRGRNEGGGPDTLVSRSPVRKHR